MDGTTVIKIDYYEELKAKADKYDEILKISTEYAVGKLDGTQAIILVADLQDAWVE